MASTSEQHSGYGSLNRATVRQICQAVDANPDGNLEDTLRKILSSYQVTRSRVDGRRAKKQEQINCPPLPKPLIPSKETKRWSLLSQCSAILAKVDTLSPTVVVPLSPLAMSALGLADNASPVHVAAATLRTLCNREPLAVNGARAIIPLNQSVVVKAGSDIGVDELSLLQYLEHHVPEVTAPRALGYICVGQLSCLLLSRMSGETLNTRWPSLSPIQKLSVQSSLNDMLSAIRKIELPSGMPFGSLSLNPVCKDTRRSERISDRPFYHEADFNDFLVYSNTAHVAPYFRTWIRRMLRDNHRIVLTHGDLHGGNIIVDDVGDGCINVSLIDWELGGFYPEYWELLKAHNLRSVSDHSDWWHHLPSCLGGDKYDIERAVDMTLESNLLAWQ